jgi:hypothetical protein
MRYFYIIISVIVFVTSGVGQSNQNNQVFWSPTRKLSINDFGIKADRNGNTLSFAQFSLDYQVNGFDFMTKNFNKKVRSYLIVSASWIDSTRNVNESLRYQQTLFDIFEIYTRTFRKELKENRRKIATGVQFIEELNQKVMTDFANRRVVYDKESNYGTISEIQQNWEAQILKELDELKEFAYDK